MLKSSLKTRFNYLCSLLDPKVLAALLAQAPLGPQSFHLGLSLGRMKGLYAERRQGKAMRRLISSSLLTYKSSDATGTRGNCTCGCNTRRWILGCSSLPHLLLVPHTEKQNSHSVDAARFHSSTLPKNSPNCGQWCKEGQMASIQWL